MFAGSRRKSFSSPITHRFCLDVSTLVWQCLRQSVSDDETPGNKLLYCLGVCDVVDTRLEKSTVVGFGLELWAMATF